MRKMPEGDTIRVRPEEAETPRRPLTPVPPGPARETGPAGPAGPAEGATPTVALKLSDSDSAEGFRRALAAELEATGGYEILGVIARGGMGVVYRARQKSLNRVVALKVLLAGEEATEVQRERFAREAAAAARLQHPGIVPIHETGEIGGRRFFTMGLVEGESLAVRVRRDGPLPPRRALEIVLEVAEALAYAHREGVIHRDIKPANILLDREGEPRITDFGLAKDVKAGGLTLSGEVMGTPAYMAPEQARGETARIDARTDVYSLGAVLYELLVGAPPFRGASLYETMILATSADPLPPSRANPKVHRDVETICLKCLAKAPSARYEDAKALADDIRRWLEGEPIVARPAGPLERLGRRLAKNKALTGVALAAVAAVAATAGYGVHESAGRERRRAEEIAQVLAAGHDGLAARQPQAAYDAFTRVLALDPANAEAAAWREAARRQLDEDIARRGREATAHRLLAWGKALRDVLPRRAREHLLRAKALHPTLFEAYALEAELAERLENDDALREAHARGLGELAAARTALAAAEGPSDPSVERAREGFYGALRAFEQALKLDREAKAALRGKVEAVLGLGDSARARHELKVALEHYAYAGELGATDADLAPRREALDEAFGIARLLKDGDAAMLAKDYAAARAHFEQALERRPSPDVERRLRAARLELGLEAARRLARDGDARAGLASVAAALAVAVPEDRPRIDAAEQECRRAGHDAALARGARRLAEGDADGAVRACEEALSFLAESPEARRLHAETLAEASVPDGFVLVRGGPFVAGSAADKDNNPLREVDVPAFYIAVREVTNAEYRAFVEAGGYARGDLFGEDGAGHLAAFVARDRRPGPLEWADGTFPPDEGDRPVTGISFHEARAYAAFAGARLPTEVEWEKAASLERGLGPEPPRRRIYPWGEKWSPLAGAFELARPRAAGAPSPDRSPCGALDMGGNASEWTVAVAAGGAAPDREAAVLKGGNYRFASQTYARAAWRSPAPLPREMRNEASGLRLARGVRAEGKKR